MLSLLSPSPKPQVFITQVKTFILQMHYISTESLHKNDLKKKKQYFTQDEPPRKQKLKIISLKNKHSSRKKYRNKKTIIKGDFIPELKT